MMKKTVAMLLSVVMLVFGVVPVMADTPQSRAAQEFASALDEAGLNYTYNGVVSSGRCEVLVLTYSSGVLGNSNVRFYFYLDGDSVTLAWWNVIDYDVSMVNAVMEACNSLNYDYRYVRFYTDSTDNSVTAQVDLKIDDSFDCSNLISSGLLSMIDIVEKAYSETLSQYQSSGLSGTGTASSILSSLGN